MPGAFQVSIVYSTTNTFGLSKDADLLKDALPIAGRIADQRVGVVKVYDSRAAPVVCDVAIHLEIPYAVWFPWAKVNVVLVNSEWWLEDKWSEYWDSIDVAIFRDKASLDMCLERGGRPRQAVIIPWCSSPSAASNPKEKKPALGSVLHKDGFVWFLGGSPNKRAAAELFVPVWKAEWPRLLVCSLEPLKLDATALPPNVTLRTGFIADAEKTAMELAHPGHICISKAESFGYTAAEAERVAAFTLLNTLPVYKSDYMTTAGVEWIQSTTDENGCAVFDEAASARQRRLENAVNSFLNTDLAATRQLRRASAEARKANFFEYLANAIKHMKEAWENATTLPKHMPPVLNPPDCPPISVVTLVHNRPKFVENACVNLLSSDYPRDKIEWVIVDDSDATESASDRIVQFAQTFAPGKVTYIPLTKKKSIGAKRNIGCEKAANQIILMMDDDDHVPHTSFRRRVAWLLKGRKRYECATCTTIAMYDLQKGTSAVNVPPYSLSLAERCSEATLTFTKSFWQERKFEDVSMAEGEAFLKGRCAQVLEMPPQQILVAFTHGTNTGSRGMPDAGNGCFWGFPRQYLEFIHGLVGVKVEEA